jgi:hypothetical protein
MDNKTLIFIEKANKIHNKKYNYDKVKYINAKEKIIINCNKHGDFLLSPNNHLSGRQCKFCNLEKPNLRRKTTEQFISEAILIHGDEYNYDKVKYVNNLLKVEIICKKHGSFLQQPSTHLNGRKCFKCKGSQKIETEEFIIKAKSFHGDKYDYTKTRYITSNDKVIITCKIHGDFTQIASSHYKQGCYACGLEISKQKQRKKIMNFILESNKIHENKYNYNKSIYINSKTNLIINCKEHGDFLQTPDSHINGHKGCPKCVSFRSSYQQKEWITFLKFWYPNLINCDTNNNYNYGEYKINGSNYHADGYDKETNTIFEYHGCFYHGCFRCYKNRNNINKLVKKTNKELLNKTIKKALHCLNEKYRYFCIWEHEWVNFIKVIRKIQKKYKKKIF